MRVWKSVVVALMLLTMVFVMPVGAATTPPPTLTGEVLNASNVITNEPFFQCTSYLVGTASYTVMGIATGPYTGPFTEHITITVNGHSSPTLIRRFDAQTETEDGLHISGTSLAEPVPLSRE